MPSANIEKLLDVWERGLNQGPLQQSFILLTAVFPNSDPDDLLQLSIGQRDAQLLALRKNLFGQSLLNTTSCPQCDERMEWQNEVDELLAEASEINHEKKEFEFEIDDYHLKFRLPNSLDIAAVVNAGDIGQAQQLVFTRCILSALNCGSTCNIDHLPAYVQEKLINEFEQLDPLANIQMDLQCPACSNSWSAVFDIGRFLWTELNDWAEKILLSNFQLASAFGWTERDIFSLSPMRRQFYLGMI